jgi:hypothetical protein
MTAVGALLLLLPLAAAAVLGLFGRASEEERTGRPPACRDGGAAPVSRSRSSRSAGLSCPRSARSFRFPHGSTPAPAQRLAIDVGPARPFGHPALVITGVGA